MHYLFDLKYYADIMSIIILNLLYTQEKLYIIIPKDISKQTVSIVTPHKFWKLFRVILEATEFRDGDYFI